MGIFPGFIRDEITVTVMHMGISGLTEPRLLKLSSSVLIDIIHLTVSLTQQKVVTLMDVNYFAA